MSPAAFPHFGELCATLTALVWAGAVVLFRVSGRSLSPLALNLFKNTVALALFLPTLVWLGGGLSLHLSFRDWLLVAASGLVGLAAGDTLFFACLNRLGVGLSAVIDCLYSPLVVLFSFILLGERLTAGHLVGGGLILSAVLLPTADPLASGLARGTFWSGMFLGALSMAAMALGVVIIKPVLNRTPDLALVTTVRLAIGTAPLYFLWLHPGSRDQVRRAFIPSRIWRASLPASFLGAYLGMLLWLAGAKFTLVGVAALLNQLSAMLLILFGRIFLRETMDWRKVSAVLLGTAGAVIIFLS